MPVFVDTNVLVYARDGTEKQKQPVARAWLDYLWRERDGRLSFQVLQEFYETVTRKLSPGLPRADARRDVEAFLAWRPSSVDGTVVAGAWELEDRFELSFWHALIASAAVRAGCRWLLTEDLQDGQDLSGLLVVNPFRHQPGTLS